jgi:hypothetical protein
MKMESLNRRICPLRFTAGALREGHLQVCFAKTRRWAVSLIWGYR